jgi:hypothetical protein
MFLLAQIYKKFKASNGWFERFLKRNKISMRTRTSAPLLLKKSFEKDLEPKLRNFYKTFDKTMATI